MLDTEALLQVLPQRAERQAVPGYGHDPLAEADAVAAPGIIHKYQGRALMLDGFGFLDELRERGGYDDLPVFVLPAHELTAEEKKFLKGHADQVLSKGEDNLGTALAMVRSAV